MTKSIHVLTVQACALAVGAVLLCSVASSSHTVAPAEQIEWRPPAEATRPAPTPTTRPHNYNTSAGASPTPAVIYLNDLGEEVGP